MDTDLFDKFKDFVNKYNSDQYNTGVVSGESANYTLQRTAGPDSSDSLASDNLASEVENRINDAIKMFGMDRREVLNRAVCLLDYLMHLQESGGRVQVRTEDGGVVDVLGADLHLR